ncbi:MAG TPA: SDR family NAD(P)-dependent oxidoreductase [Candidatus Sulfotelmatobacter sp.]|nr:SDR family NAD(P)-dependent oxidoreductase [Candidatus Sulfotelmatobacter sp.]
MAEPSAPASGRLAGRIALVTGASRGLGAAVGRLFAREGAHVILVARTVGGLEEVDDAIRAEGRAATLVPIDLMDRAKIEQAAQAIAERFGRLDVLVGNAGLLGGLYPVGQMPDPLWDSVFATNVGANARLIGAFDPLLRASGTGRAIFVTSRAAETARAYWGAYAASKAALETLVRIYAAEVQRFAVKVNLIDPGPVRSQMRAQAFPGEDPNSLPTPDDVAPWFLGLAEAGCTRHGEIIRVAAAR